MSPIICNLPVVFMCDLHLLVSQEAPNNGGLWGKSHTLIFSTFFQLQLQIMCFFFLEIQLRYIPVIGQSVLDTWE